MVGVHSRPAVGEHQPLPKQYVRVSGKIFVSRIERRLYSELDKNLRPKILSEKRALNSRRLVMQLSAAA